MLIRNCTNLLISFYFVGSFLYVLSSSLQLHYCIIVTVYFSAIPYFPKPLLRWTSLIVFTLGMGKGPLFGDLEAQRHWMEITIHLPIYDWYISPFFLNLGIEMELTMI